jgi:signal transduction histidine kinase
MKAGLGLPEGDDPSPAAGPGQPDGLLDRLKELPPAAIDAAIAGVLIGAGLLQQFGAPHPEHGAPGAPNQLVHAAVIVAAILPLLLRRRYPVLTVVLMSAVIGIAGSIGPFLAYDPSPASAFGLMFATFNAAALGGRVRGWFALTLAVVAVTLILRPWVTPVAAWLPSYPYYFVAFLAGRAQRQRRSLTRALEDLIVDEEAQRERLRQICVQDARAGLARDVHDVVVFALEKASGHAREALRRLGSSVGGAEPSLRATEDAGRRALVELRVLLDVLRGSDPAGQSDSSLDLRGLEQLLREVVPTCVDVRVRDDGDGDGHDISPPVALAACRIVQYVLANGIRDELGGAFVIVGRDDDVLAVEVHGERRGNVRSPARLASLSSLRERLALVGGTVVVRRQPGVGHWLLVRLPLLSRGTAENVGEGLEVPTSPGLSSAVDLSWRLAFSGLGRGWPVDVALVAVLTTGALLEFRIWEETLGPGLPTEVFSTAARGWAIAWILLLLLRRPAPVLTGVAMAVMAFLQTYPFRFWTPVSDIAALQIAVYTIGSLKPRHPHAWLVAGLGAVGLVSIPPPPVHLGVVGFLVIIAVTLGGAAYVGTVVGERRGLNEELEQRRAALAEERRTELALALRQQRLAVARDMHDLVAHSLTLMVVQAGAARTVGAADPEVADKAVRVVLDTGRQATQELGQLLTLLSVGDPSQGPPRLGSWDVEDLVAQARQSGLEVELARSGNASPPVGSSLEVSAFRIVQEALTNVRKHAPGSRVAVHVHVERGAVALRIENDPSTSTPADLGALGAGAGLIGMRERVAVFGGRLEAGPRPGGGFVVDALLPREGTAT